jgi:predicted RNA-binding Zn ribbon-like protein
MLPPNKPEEVSGLPPGIALIHQFVNTEDLRTYTAHGRRLEARDGLPTPSDLARWLREHDLAAPGAVTETHLARARALRTALRAALCQDGEDAEVLPGYSFDVKLAARRGADLVISADPVTTALARIVVAAVIATADGTWHRLRMCPAPDCQWVFYDQSRPGRARWCSPRLCGNRMKTQAYRRRGPAGKP